jgi:hypothetical protein
VGKPGAAVLADKANLQGWEFQNINSRVAGDVSGDGKADIIGMDGRHNIRVSLSTSSGTTISFGTPTLGYFPWE